MPQECIGGRLLVFVVEVALVAHGLAEAEGEDDAEDLDPQDGHRHDDHDVQVGDDPVVDSLVAALKGKITSVIQLVLMSLICRGRVALSRERNGKLAKDVQN